MIDLIFKTWNFTLDYSLANWWVSVEHITIKTRGGKYRADYGANNSP
jgi:hypothetical protein